MALAATWFSRASVRQTRTRLEHCEGSTFRRQQNAQVARKCNVAQQGATLFFREFRNSRPSTELQKWARKVVASVERDEAVPRDLRSCRVRQTDIELRRSTSVRSFTSSPPGAI